MAHPFWGAVENLNISGGEPTTRNDLPEMVELFQRHLPRMRKIGINTTGLTPHRAIPMLTRIVEVLRRARPALQHPRVARRHRRHPRPGPARQARLRQGVRRRSRRCRRWPRSTPNFQFGIAVDDLRDEPRGRARTSSPGRATQEARHRVQHAAVHRRHAEQQGARGEDRLPRARGRVHAQVLPRSRAGGVGAERPGVHVPALRGHDRQRLPPDDAVPVPDARGCCSTRTAICSTARTRRSIGNVLDDAGRELYFKAENLAHREQIEERRSARPA